jgi:bifunctional polynucleotide phosphatase/kinase
LQIPILACIATAEDKYRKPCLGMWNFLNSYNKIKINADESVFCGDAAGRNSKQFKDFNDTDLKFALNIGF